jgi:hypothetical protein
MDPEEKKDLKKNDLESFLVVLWHRIKQYGAYILLVFALAFLGWQLLQRQKTKEQVHKDEGGIRLSEAKTAAMRAFERSLTGTPENPVKLYEEIINDFKDVKPVAADAQLALGNFYNMMIVTGRLDVANINISKTDAIAKARDAFNSVLNEFAEFPTRVAAAKLGLAGLLETEGGLLKAEGKSTDGDKKFDEAKKAYEEIASDTGPWAGSVYASEAKRKIKMQDMIRGKIELAADPIPQTLLPGTMGPIAPSDGVFSGTKVPLAPIIEPTVPVDILPKFGQENPPILRGLNTPLETPTTMQGIGGTVVPTTQP